MINGGGTADDRTRSHIIWDAGLAGGDSTVANLAVSRHTHLAGKDDVVSDFGGTGEADLGAQQAVFPDHGTVSDLRKIVDFRSRTNAGQADTGAIDAGVGLHFNIVIELGGAGLDDLAPAALVILREAEAIGANDRAVLKDDAIAKTAIFTHDGMGMGKETVADARPAVNHDMGKKNTIVPDHHVFRDDDVGTNGSVLADTRGAVYDGGGMNAGSVLGWLVKKFDGMGKCEIGVVTAQQGDRPNGEVFTDDDGRGARATCGSRVFGIGKESQLAWACLFNARHTGDFGVRRAVVQ